MKNIECFQDSSFREDVRRMLTRDMFRRRERCWPLQRYHGVVNFWTEFPALSTILDRHRGKLTLCGGLPGRAMAKESLEHETTLDADLFFHNSSREEANEILEDCVATVVSIETKRGLEVRIERRQFLTNVVVHKRPANTMQLTRVYQFVQRLYPSLDAVLGGFDIPLSSVAYDGINFWVTESAVWSFLHQCIVVDTTRRSTSYEHRLLKYVRRFKFSIFFPGVDYTPQERQNVDQIVTSILERLEANGYGLTGRNGPVSNPRSWLTDHIYDSGIKQRFEYIVLKRKGRIAPHYKPLDEPARLITNIKKYSDYSDCRMFARCIPKANATALRANNFEAVVVYVDFADNPMSERQARATFRELVEAPKVQTELLSFRTRVGSIGHDINRIKTLGMLPWATGDVSFSYNDYVKKEAARLETVLTGLSWIEDNPGRQWTSSRNPIFEDPRKFYGSTYVPFLIGIPSEIETCLRLMRLRRDNPFHTLPKDAFNIVLKQLAYLYA